MDSHVKPLLSKLNGRQLIELCNEKMVCAARDLAEFTKRGLNANFIVSLALKCEEFEKKMTKAATSASAGLMMEQEDEIRDALVQICETGKSIWPSHSPKYHDYLLPAHLYESLRGSSNVA